MNIVRATQQQKAADQEWAAAFAAHEQVEPELIPFAGRLRNTSMAASHRAEALEYAPRAGITELMPDPMRRHPPTRALTRCQPPRPGEFLGRVRRGHHDAPRRRTGHQRGRPGQIAARLRINHKVSRRHHRRDRRRATRKRHTGNRGAHSRPPRNWRLTTATIAALARG
jgi:hypothetical protein